ncbi:MAG: RNA polymerase sigma factor [Oscillospiraceae bacterium]|nr:RNA polymerase sigma factor [Oscillospiraceae bacterium]
MISAALAVLETEEQRNELSVLYEKHKNRFLNIALELLHNKEEAEDAVQETFLRIAEKPDNFFSVEETNRLSYLCAVLKNVAYYMFNKEIKTQKEDLTEYIFFKNEESFIEESVFDKISRYEILSFIDNLPKLQRNVLMLTCLSGLSISETAEILQVSKTVVNQRLYLARKSIKQFIAERNKDND